MRPKCSACASCWPGPASRITASFCSSGPRTRSALTETVTGRIDALNSEGWGVVPCRGRQDRVRGRRVARRTGRVPRATARTQSRRGRAGAVLEAAPDRIAPRCAHFGICGGCSLQHLAPESQLRREGPRTARGAAAHRQGGARAAGCAPLAGEPWGYRRRARLGARFVHAKGRSLVGFREKMSSYVADVRALRGAAAGSRRAGRRAAAGW